MSYQDFDVIIDDEPTTSLADLTALYNQTKALDTADSSKLTSNFTLSGVDGVQDIIAAAMLQIQEFTDHGKAPTTTSKVLARVAPEGSWLGKFVNSKTAQHKLESIKEQSISQVVKTLRDSINSTIKPFKQFVADTNLSDLKASVKTHVEQLAPVKDELGQVIAHLQKLFSK